jgi:hypothetical protein
VREKTMTTKKSSARKKAAPATLTALVDGVWIHRSSQRLDGVLVAANGLLSGHALNVGAAAARASQALLIDTTWSGGQALALHEQAKALA